jgi:hypothetical protein
MRIAVAVALAALAALASPAQGNTPGVVSGLFLGAEGASCDATCLAADGTCDEVSVAKMNALDASTLATAMAAFDVWAHMCWAHISLITDPHCHWGPKKPQETQPHSHSQLS